MRAVEREKGPEATLLLLPMLLLLLLPLARRRRRSETVPSSLPLLPAVKPVVIVDILLAWVLPLSGVLVGVGWGAERNKLDAGEE